MTPRPAPGTVSSVRVTRTHPPRHLEAFFDLVAVALVAAAVFVPGYESGCTGRPHQLWIMLLLGAASCSVVLAVVHAARSQRSLPQGMPAQSVHRRRVGLPAVPTIVTIVLTVAAWREMGAGPCGE